MHLFHIIYYLILQVYKVQFLNSNLIKEVVYLDDNIIKLDFNQLG